MISNISPLLRYDIILLKILNTLYFFYQIEQTLLIYKYQDLMIYVYILDTKTLTMIL